VEIAAQFLAVARGEFRRLKRQAEQALAQVDDDALRSVLGPESNSLAIIVRHLAGNMRSRWTDFLTTDGEKPDRKRDGEFETASQTRHELLAEWEDGWARLFSALEALRPGDLSSNVTIRGEALCVIDAIARQLTHYGVHVGQIVLLAKHFAGERWKTLSIARAPRP
jgi:hypothetical protein